MVLVNSRLGLLTAALYRSPGMPVHSRGRSFSRSYGSNLPSSLTKVLPFASRYLPPPTSVGLRYGHVGYWQRGFSRRPGLNPVALTKVSTSPESSAYPGGGFTCLRTPTAQERTISIRSAGSTLPGPPSALKRDHRGAGILTSCPSPTPLGLGLGPTNPTRTDLP